MPQQRYVPIVGLGGIGDGALFAIVPPESWDRWRRSGLWSAGCTARCSSETRLQGSTLRQPVLHGGRHRKLALRGGCGIGIVGDRLGGGRVHRIDLIKAQRIILQPYTDGGTMHRRGGIVLGE